jgi:PBSX family phage terminase large subunit
MSKRISEVIGSAFYPLAHDVFTHGHTHYDLSGGRGSLKSSCVSLLVPTLLMMQENKNAHALVLRKVGNTLRDSVYAQYLWAIGELGVAEYWTAKVSPMELIYTPTGQKIMFRGADDPMKIKSIKVPFGYIAITHFEEKDQFAGRPEIRNILQSTMRGGSKFWDFESYNPPISRDNWANKDSLEERSDRLTHRSTYLDAPPEWLGEQFLAEAEHLKQTDERAYRHEYLGEPVGTGGNVFDRLELREITDEEISHFDRIYQGADWGYFPDPYAFIRLHYDKTRETIYLLDEIYVNKKSNEETGNEIKRRGYGNDRITCDSAEPKSVGDYRSMGLPAWGAIKGAGSVDYGMKFLQRRTIVIDRRRTPHAYNEFVNYEYERDKNGEIISGYPDANNHLIDATRYALERESRRYGVLA